jgi:hypothetical protein
MGLAIVLPFLPLLLLVIAFHADHKGLPHILAVFLIPPCVGLMAIAARAILGRGLIRVPQIHVPRGLPKLLGVLGILGAIPLSLKIGLFLARSGEAETAMLHHDSLELGGAIHVAMGCTRESLRGHLVYPAHTLVVFTVVDQNVFWDEQASSYHYACPSEWLATKKDDVKLVVLVSRGATVEIGHYWPGGSSAYMTTWNPVFVDLASRSIVAKGKIAEYDPDWPSLLDWRNHESRPTGDEVVSTIRGTVNFAQ